MAKARKAAGSRAWPTTAALGDQISLATAQIDGFVGGRLGWVVQFAREDPASWLPGQAESHGFRLLALVYQERPLSVRDVENLQRDVASLLRDVTSAPAGTVVSVPTDGLVFGLVRMTKPGEKRAIYGSTRGGPYRTILLHKVAELIAGSDRLTSCPVCGQPFLALRKRLFCSDKCTQRHHDRLKVAAKRKGV